VAWPAGQQASGYVGFYEDREGVAFIGSQKSGYELLHRIPTDLMETAWAQHTASTVPAGEAVDAAANGTLHTVLPKMSLADNGGFSLSLWVLSKGVPAGPVPVTGADDVARAAAQGSMLSARCDDGDFEVTAWSLFYLMHFTFSLSLGSAGRATTLTASGKCAEQLSAAGRHHVGVIVDGGAHVS
jgi:hypothetical protein